MRQNKTYKKLDLPTFLNFIPLELGIGNRVSILLFRRVEFPVRVRVSMEKITWCNNSSGNYTLV